MSNVEDAKTQVFIDQPGSKPLSRRRCEGRQGNTKTPSQGTRLEFPRRCLLILDILEQYKSLNLHISPSLTNLLQKLLRHTKTPSQGTAREELSLRHQGFEILSKAHGASITACKRCPCLRMTMYV
ncbi:hypothetical protein KP509_36G057400 [Ceratopteris richardii]|uniref:Uncharacterized protein n=1 Tax=Ceratopteris richardii TaxID=49495 RepID=A0A8T2QDZ0_CERRI|nr:hypothetical protein KP509_36G057400 [Ceratopteris richardii]